MPLTSRERCCTKSLCALRHMMREALVKFLWICRHFLVKLIFFCAWIASNILSSISNIHSMEWHHQNLSDILSNNQKSRTKTKTKGVSLLIMLRKYKTFSHSLEIEIGKSCRTTEKLWIWRYSGMNMGKCYDQSIQRENLKKICLDHIRNPMDLWFNLVSTFGFSDSFQEK